MLRTSEDFSPSFMFRWLPAIAWLVTFALYSGMSAYLANSTSRRLDAPWSSWAFVLGLCAVAVFSLVVTVRASRDARAMGFRADDGQATPPRTARVASEPPESATTAVPGRSQLQEAGPATTPFQALAGDGEQGPVTEDPGIQDSVIADSVIAEPMQHRLAGMLMALENAGILEPGEVTIEAALEAAELAGEFEHVGLDELLAVLDTVEAERGGGFRHLALYSTQGEVFDQQIIHFVEDAARLAGRLDSLGAVELEGLGEGTGRAAPQAALGPTNAVVHFALDGQWHAVPFMMFPEGFPLELIEGLAAVLVPEAEGRVFVEAWSDGLVAISCIDRDRLADLDAALAWDGETFGMVAPASIDELEPSPEVSDSVAVRPG